MQRNMSRNMEDIILLNQMGIVCRRRKEFDRAKLYYDRALQLAPGDESLNYNYAVLLVDMKDYQTARNYLKHVLRQNPDFENAVALLAMLDKREAAPSA